MDLVLATERTALQVEHLQETNPSLYEANKAETESGFLFLEPVTGLDGTKLSEAQKAEEANA